jgi:4,5-DOPA dioxygenase extradiol
MRTLPALFLSHGSPMTALEPGAAGAFFERLGPAIDAAFGRPQAIVARSAHTLTREPVVPVGWNPRSAPDDLFALGSKLTPLADEGMLVIGSGSITHNLHRVAQAGFHTQSTPAEIAESTAFRRWFVERLAALDWEALADYRRQAPHAADMHPSDEHLLPWYIAAGAGGRDSAPVRLHDSVTHGCLGMDAYAFGPGASALAAALR